MRVLTHSLLREAVDVPSPGSVQGQTRWTLHSGLVENVLPHGRGLEWDISKVPSNPKHSFLDNIRFCTLMNTAEITEQKFGMDTVFQRISEYSPLGPEKDL